MNTSLPPIHEIWVYLSGSPLLALTLTLTMTVMIRRPLVGEHRYILNYGFYLRKR